jgi:hypothetical protein
VVQSGIKPRAGALIAWLQRLAFGPA